MITHRFHLAAPDGKLITGVLDYASETRADRIVILSHGLAGSPDEFLHVTAARYFRQQGYDVLRIRYYSKDEGARMLEDCTFLTHARDLAVSVGALRRDYKKIFVCGHSSGGLVAMMAQLPATALSLWDPAFIRIFFVPHAVYVPELDCYKVGRGAQFLVGRAMLEEAQAWQNETMCLDLLRRQIAPLQVAVSDRTGQMDHIKILRDNLRANDVYVEIGGADHLFTKDGAADALLQETARWFGRF